MLNLFLVAEQACYRKIGFGQQASRLEDSRQRRQPMKRHTKDWKYFLFLSLGAWVWEKRSQRIRWETYSVADFERCFTLIITFNPHATFGK